MASREQKGVAQATSTAGSGRGQARREPSRAGRYAPRPHFGRLAVLVLLVVGAAFYVAPLRDFFAQQDRYEKAAAELAAARRDNAALEREVDLLATKAHIAQLARSDSMLVPPNTQVFVIKGLPGKDEENRFSTATPPVEASISVLDRIEDLWRTLLH
jgi:cell division protein FtsB